MNYYMAGKRSDVGTSTTKWMNPENSMLREISEYKSQRSCSTICMNISKIGKSMEEARSRLGVVRGGCRMDLGFLECTDALELDRRDGCITSGVK